MKIIADNIAEQGFALIEADGASNHMFMLKEKFKTRYASRFRDNPIRNRNIIKLFAEDLDVKRFFCSLQIERILTDYSMMAEPVQIGPIVTHYTAGDLTGNNYGLPYHQDWPSMGTSAKAVIVWTSITDVEENGPGLRIIPQSHLAGLWPGDQTDNGYLLQQQEITGHLDISIKAGQILLMSPYLVHKTRTSSSDGWKLSLSCRFDDLSSDDWNNRNYINAYRTTIDRTAYLK